MGQSLDKEPDFVSGYYIKGYKYSNLRSLKYFKGDWSVYQDFRDIQLKETTIEKELEDMQGEKVVEAIEKVLLRCWQNIPLMFIFLKTDLFETNFWNKVQDIDNLQLYFKTKLDTKTNYEFSKHLSSTNIFRWS